MRIDLEDFEGLDALQARVSVLFEQGIEHRARLVPVLDEHVALANVRGPLAARERRLVECDVADEIEGVDVVAYLFGPLVEKTPLAC